MKNKNTGAKALEVFINQFFGVRFINYLNGAITEDQYMDIDLDLQKVTDNIFLVAHNGEIFITSGGLSFADIIYVG